MPEKVRLTVRERITLKKWDHDCPTEHGGTCKPEVVVMEWENGVPVDTNKPQLEDKNAAANTGS